MMSWKMSLSSAACALLLTAAATQAQSTTMFNVRFGPTYAWRDVNQSALESSGLAAMGGGGGFRIIRGAYSFDPTLLIVMKGTKSVDASTGGDEKLKLQYIELPLVSTLTLFTSGRLKPFIEAGPVIDLEMRCRVLFILGNSQDDVACDLDSNATVNRHKIDIGVAGGGGLDYNLESNRHLLLEVRYTHGLSNISASDDKSLTIRNRAVSVYLGYAFPLKADM